MKAQVIEKAAVMARTSDDKKALAEAALQMIDEAIREHNWELAEKLGKQASHLADLCEDMELIRKSAVKSKEVDAVTKVYTDLKAAIARLKKEPTDPDANATIGKHLCFSEGNWGKGLPMLIKGSDDKLKTLAEKDIAGAASSKEQVELGDAWWDAGGKERAIYWYLKAFPELGGLERDRVGKRLPDYKHDRF